MKNKITHTIVTPNKSEAKKLRKIIADVEKNGGEFDLAKARHPDGTKIQRKKKENWIIQKLLDLKTFLKL